MDVKFSRALYDFTVHYKLIYYPSKVIEFISDTIGLPILFILYAQAGAPAPITFATYVLFFMLIAELFVKRLFKRKRPEWTFMLGFAFPSSHSLLATICFTVLLFVPIPLKPLFLGFLFLIPLNRIMLGHHYIADVIMGVMLGALAGILWLLGLPLMLHFMLP
ncbi:MAG: phosphatase PAP2 family protein [Candidatus Dojkabacteria bacterium]|nr:MAG: phosphatase PAP2 family protein [Candidatus Dojkabacteria bacterium]